MSSVPLHSMDTVIKFQELQQIAKSSHSQTEQVKHGKCSIHAYEKPSSSLNITHQCPNSRTSNCVQKEVNLKLLNANLTHYIKLG